jgi:putative ABC transport system substrate-binding protein
MRRREFLTALGGAAAANILPFAARAQQAAGHPLIGVLSPLSMATAAGNIEAFRAGLRGLGYVEGRNLNIEFRYAEGAAARMPEIAAELVALKPAVIVTGSPSLVMAVHKATRTIPVVMNSSADPMALGLAASMARPGGNVTGFWTEGDEDLIGKRLELLKDALPGTSRVGIVVNPDDVRDTVTLKALPAAARTLGLTVRVIEARTAGEFEAAFATAAREGVQGLYISTSPLFSTHRMEIAALAVRARLPSVSSVREFAVAGVMISYAASLPDNWRRMAVMVDKILKGASPGEIPIERPVKFELVVNLKTAKAIGLTIPETFLVRADEVIE